MPVKFLEITNDPYTNDTSLFVLVLNMFYYPTPSPTSPGSSNVYSGVLSDPRGETVGIMWLAAYQDYEVTGSLSDEAYAHSWTHDANTLLIPPGYTFKTFSYAIALQGTLEELAPFMMGK